MTLDDLEGFQIRLIGPKVERGTHHGVGKTDEHLGAVAKGAVVISAPNGLYDLAFRKDLKSPWLSSPKLGEYRVTA